MPNRLNVPDELKHLIEKRADDDRRDRNAGAAEEPAAPLEPAAERRQGGRRALDGEEESPEPKAK